MAFPAIAPFDSTILSEFRSGCKHRSAAEFLVERGARTSAQALDKLFYLETLEVGDIVLCKVNGREYLHLIKAIQGARFQIGNNRGFINGWVGHNAIFGRCVKVED